MLFGDLRYLAKLLQFLWIQSWLLEQQSLQQLQMKLKPGDSYPAKFEQYTQRCNTHVIYFSKNINLRFSLHFLYITSMISVYLSSVLTTSDTCPWKHGGKFRQLHKQFWVLWRPATTVTIVTVMNSWTDLYWVLHRVAVQVFLSMLPYQPSLLFWVTGKCYHPCIKGQNK